MPSKIIQRINDDHAANQAHIAKQCPRYWQPGYRPH